MAPINTLTASQLSAISGGHGDMAPSAGDPFAPVGSAERCKFLDSEIENRQVLIAADAVKGSIGGNRRELTPRMYGNGAILSRDLLEFRQRCGG